jgi:Big-like domain-containing protein
MRTLLIALALLSVSPVSAQAPNAAVSFLGHTRDLVSSGFVLSANGAADITFEIRLSAMTSIAGVKVQGPRGTWNTDPAAGNWAAGVTASPTTALLNSPTGVNLSTQAFYVYVDEGGDTDRFPVGGTVTVTLSLVGGGTVTASASVPDPTAIPPLGDVTAPSVSITFPKDGVTYAGTKTIGIFARADDDIGIASLQFYLNGIPAGGPWLFATGASFTWETRAVPNGTYTWEVEAKDEAGNVTRSAPVRFTVQN